MPPLSLTDLTVLVAEDERPVRMLLRVVLEHSGATVLEAENGAVALRLLDLHPGIDLLCTDVHMPTMDGQQLVERLRTGPLAHLPVVACTAMDLERTHPRLATLVDGVVQKPFVPADLIRAIDRARSAGLDGAAVGST